MSQTIFVTGATGQQGSTVIDALLSSPSSSNITIHGLTRNPSSPPAKALLAKYPNVKLFQGSFEDISSISSAASNCSSAFLNVSPVFTDSGIMDTTGESRHARNLVQACSDIPSIERVVFSSTAAMHSTKLTEIFDEYIPKYPSSSATSYMTSKKACEDAITTSKFPDGWAILRGVTFMSNFIKPFTNFMYPELESKQTITTAYSEDYKISLVDPADIGVLVARILLSTPEEWSGTWKGKFVPLLGDNLTMTEVVAEMNAVLAKQDVRKQIKLVQLDEEGAVERAKNGDMIVEFHTWVSRYMPTFDIEEVRSFGIDVNGLTKAKSFFDRESEKLIEAVGGA